MRFHRFIKTIFFSLLTFLLGVQTTYAKTELVLPQNQTSFSIEQSQSFKSLEKQLQPNIGFLKEKYRFVILQSISAQNPYNYTKVSCEYLANGGGDLAGYVSSLLNKNIRSAILDVAESRVVAQKYFNRINQTPGNYLSDYTLHLDDFDTWYSNVFKSNLFEAHHIIPKNVLRDNGNFQSILDWARNNGKNWDFGNIDNGIMLQKRRKNSLGEVVGDHANHPKYDEYITKKIDDIFTDSNGNMSDAFDDLVDFVDDLKLELNSQVVEGDKIVNTLIVP